MCSPHASPRNGVEADVVLLTHCFGARQVVSRVQERQGFKLFDDKLFPGIRLLHADPVVFEVEDFFTPEECDAYVAMSTEKQSGRRKGGFKSMEVQSATTSSESQFQQQRTSTTWFHHYASAPELLAKASALLGVEDHRQWEEPQTVRYRPGERFNWHLDALPPSETGASKGGQRTATILVSCEKNAMLLRLSGCHCDARRIPPFLLTKNTHDIAYLSTWYCIPGIVRLIPKKQ